MFKTIIWDNRDGFGVEKEICLKVIEDARNLVDKNYGKL